MVSQNVIPISQLEEWAKLRYLKELLSNKHFRKVALVFTASRKSHIEIGSAKKKCQRRNRTFPQFPAPQTGFASSRYTIQRYTIHP